MTGIMNLNYNQSCANYLPESDLKDPYDSGTIHLDKLLILSRSFIILIVGSFTFSTRIKSVRHRQYYATGAVNANY